MLLNLSIKYFFPVTQEAIGHYPKAFHRKTNELNRKSLVITSTPEKNRTEEEVVRKKQKERKLTKGKAWAKIVKIFKVKIPLFNYSKSSYFHVW